jgi:hypothetical protein
LFGRGVHHLFGNAIRLLLIGITRRVDGEFGTNPWTCVGMQRYVAEIVSGAGRGSGK